MEGILMKKIRLFLRIIGVIFVTVIAYQIHQVFFQRWSGETYEIVLFLKGVTFGLFVGMLCLAYYLFGGRKYLSYFMIGLVGVYFAASCVYSIVFLISRCFERSEQVVGPIYVIYSFICGSFAIITIYFLRDIVIEAWDELRKLRRKKIKETADL